MSCEHLLKFINFLMLFTLVCMYVYTYVDAAYKQVSTIHKRIHKHFNLLSSLSNKR